MKAQSLWIGSDYAWYEYRGRGGPLPLNAKRVKILEIIKEPVSYYNSRQRTLCMVQMLNDDGTPDDRYDFHKKVRARDILNFWDEYEYERRPLKEERDRKEKEYQERRAAERKKWEERNAIETVARFFRQSALKAEQLERERIERERREKELMRANRMKSVLIGRGMKPDQFSVNGNGVTVTLQEMERWLGFETVE